MLVTATLDFNSVSRIINLPAGIDPNDPVVMSQLDGLLSGLSWKDNVRVATQANLNLSAPGATIDGITMVSGDRILVGSQTSVPENGIYVWNGAATPATRATDADTFEELESAVVLVDEGTSAGVTYRQTQVNGALGTNNIVWTTFGTSAPSASETTAGIAEIATQTETNTGTDDSRFVTPLKLANSVHASRKYTTTIGDGSNDSFIVTHNLGSRNVQVSIYNTTTYEEILTDIERTSTNTITVYFTSAPTTNQYTVAVAY